LNFHAYLPQDRLRAIANDIALPDQTSGSALFADISGFTTLTEKLRETLGTRQGAEELSRQLGEVYSALIAEIEKYGGSVIGFSGDSLMCWFYEVHGSSAIRAATCAFAMQAAIKTFPTLALKVSIASGDAHRFLVGDPEIQKFDVLTGKTVTRTAVGEQLAASGDVLMDEFTVQALGDVITVMEWREDNREKFAVVRNQMSMDGDRVGEHNVFGADVQTVTPVLQALRPFLHKDVYAREIAGHEAFLTEFRPCVALFVRFTGIDYDSDSAADELDQFIQKMQQIAARYEGTVLDITIGDKGSYSHVNFGALNAHEDDSRRAIKAALELLQTSSLDLQIGITQGLIYVGAYGGTTRKQFGAMGDEVNLASRLMLTASAGEILVSGTVYKVVKSHFTFEPRQPLPIRGKVERLPVFAVTGENKRRAIRLQEPTYSLPMVGRKHELQTIKAKLDLAKQGKGQVIGIVAEAGLGKSRLVAEVIRSARRKGFIGYGGQCQSDGIQTPYLVWKSIWLAFFDVDSEMTQRTQMRLIEGHLKDRVPSRVEAMPLLNALLDLNIPENEFTKTLEPKQRQSALHALLEDCLKAAAKDEPILLVIEDGHWIDALSHDLLDQLVKALADQRVCFVAAYRPPQITRLVAPRIEALPQFTRIELHELNNEEAENAIRAKLLQLYPARNRTLPIDLVDILMERAQGNPFFLEELLNYFRDRGLDPLDPNDLHRVEIPNSLHSVILSRIDQLSEQEKTTLRTASIIGRQFRAQWLSGYYPDLGSMPQVKATLDLLDALDITPLDSELELTYLFKHIVTHEVTYESLPFATRARLHEQLARYLESIAGAENSPSGHLAASLLGTIAFHYLHSENQAKQREYLLKAGESAQQNFANDAALEHYNALIPLLTNNEEKAQLHLKRGQLLEFIGRFDEAESDYRKTLSLSPTDNIQSAKAYFALGKLNRHRDEHDVAEDFLARAQKIYSKLENKVGLIKVLIETGNLFWRKSEYEQARKSLHEGLALAQSSGYAVEAAHALNSLGLVDLHQGEYASARTLFEEGLELQRELHNKVGISTALNNLGIIMESLGDYVTAQALYEESRILDHEIGNKIGVAYSLNNIAIVARIQGSYASAQALQEESLKLKQEIGDRWGIAASLDNLGIIALAQKDYSAAQTFLEKSLNLFREMDSKSGIAAVLKDLANVALVQGDTSTARPLFEESLALSQELSELQTAAHSLLGLGLVALAKNKQDEHEYILQSLRIRQKTGERLYQISSLIGAAGLALHEEDPLLTAQLLGAVESTIKAINATLEPDIIPFHQLTVTKVREMLGEATFQSTFEEGSKWRLEEAIRKVLGE